MPGLGISCNFAFLGWCLEVVSADAQHFWVCGLMTSFNLVGGCGAWDAGSGFMVGCSP